MGQKKVEPVEYNDETDTWTFVKEIEAYNDPLSRIAQTTQKAQDRGLYNENRVWEQCNWLAGYVIREYENANAGGRFEWYPRTRWYMHS